MLLGRHIAEHRSPMIPRRRGAYTTSYMIIPRKKIGDEVAEDVEGGAVAELALDFHIPFDLVEGDVAGAFDHDLDAVTPGALGEFAEAFELGELGAIGGVGEAAGAEPVSNRE